MPLPERPAPPESRSTRGTRGWGLALLVTLGNAPGPLALATPSPLERTSPAAGHLGRVQGDAERLWAYLEAHPYHERVLGQWLEAVPEEASRRARLTQLDARLARDPGDLPARVLAARLADQLDDPFGGVLRLRDAPGSLERDLLLARLCGRAGDATAMASHYQHALDHLLEDAGEDPRRVDDLLHELLMVFHEEGELTHLRSAALRLAQRDRGDGEHLRPAAEALLRAGLHGPTVTLLEGALADEGLAPEARARLLTLRGDAQAARDRGDAALADWRAALDLLAADHWLRRDLEQRELDLCARGGVLEQLEQRRAAAAEDPRARPGTFLALARVRGRRGDAAGALAAVEAGRVRFPGSELLTAALWSELQEAADPDLLRAPLEQALRRAWDDVPALLDLARRCATTLPDLALEALDRARVLAPRDLAVLQTRHEFLRGPEGAPPGEAALASLEEWAAAAPTQAADRQALARSLLRAGRTLPACEQLRAVLEQRPRDLETRTRLADLLGDLAAAPAPAGVEPDPRAAWRVEARRHWRTVIDESRAEGPREHALERLAQSFPDPQDREQYQAGERSRRTQDPEQVLPLWVLARLAASAGHMGEAVVRAREYLALRPDDLAARTALARWLVQEERLEEALDELARLESVRGPERVGAGLAAADLYVRLGRDAEAVAALGRLQPLVRRSPELLLELGLRHRRLGRLDLAAEDARRALRLAPDSAEAARLLSSVAVEDQRPTEAQRVLREWWQRAERPAERQEALAGLARLLEGRLDAELERLVLAARANPWDVDSARLAMELALIADRPEAARAAAERRLEQDPADRRAREVRARSALEQGDLEMSLADLRVLQHGLLDGGARTEDDSLADLRAGVVTGLVAARRTEEALGLCLLAPDPRPVARDLMAHGHYRAAATLLERWTEHHGIGGDAVLELASELERYMEDPAFAVRVYRARLERDGESLELLRSLAGALARLDQGDEVRAVGRRILALDAAPEVRRDVLRSLGLLDLWAEHELEDVVARPRDVVAVRASLAALREGRHEAHRVLQAVDRLLGVASDPRRRPEHLHPELGPTQELAWRLELRSQARTTLLSSSLLRRERAEFLDRILREDGDLSPEDWVQLDLCASTPGSTAPRPARERLEQALTDSGDPVLLWCLARRAREERDPRRELELLEELLLRCSRDAGLGQFQALLELERHASHRRSLFSLAPHVSSEELDALALDLGHQVEWLEPLWYDGAALPTRSELELRTVLLLARAGRREAAGRRLAGVERGDLQHLGPVLAVAALADLGTEFDQALGELRARRRDLDHPDRAALVPDVWREQQDGLLRASLAWRWCGALQL